jgi:endonuclease YncB( thermonuclease family)
MCIRIISVAFALHLGFLISEAVAAEWTEYGACVLQTGEYTDGDSFSQVLVLKSGGQRPSALNWRLYGVDCPETDRRSEERVKEQARHFRLSEDGVIAWGKKASEFSKEFLAEPFFVYTLRQKSKGDSDKPRYYAIIVGSDGRALHEVLIEEGLARAYGMPAAWPEGISEKRFMERLEQIERSARAAKKGIWGDNR